MFGHFDERASMCVLRTQEEARRLGHEEIGAAHLLLVNDTRAARFLRLHGIDESSVRPPWIRATANRRLSPRRSRRPRRAARRGR